MKRLNKNLADYLLDEDLVRLPYNAGDEPVIFVEPTDGAPAPDDLDDTAATDITLTLTTSGGVGTPPYEGFLNRRLTRFTFRCKKGKEKDLIDFSNNIDAALDDKRAWIMGDLRIEIAQLYVPLQLINTTYTDQGAVYQSEYFFLFRKASLEEE